MSWQSDLFFRMWRRNGDKVDDAMLSAFADVLVRTESFLPVGGEESVGEVVRRQEQTIAELQQRVSVLQDENAELREKVAAVVAQRTKGGR